VKTLIHLNQSQRDAVRSALRTTCTVIQGPPGTGKTHVSVQIMKMWSKILDLSPLLATSDSNVAVDNIAMGLRKEGVKAVRVGRPDKINRILEEITLECLLEKEKVELDNRKYEARYRSRSRSKSGSPFADRKKKRDRAISRSPSPAGSENGDKDKGKGKGKGKGQSEDSCMTEPSTTFMLGNLPYRARKKDIMAALDHMGFKGTYNFCHVPNANKRKPRPTNLGYAFVGFSQASSAAAFSESFGNFCFLQISSEKRCTLKPAHWQSCQTASNLSI